jgi:hypothetical protein
MLIDDTGGSTVTVTTPVSVGAIRTPKMQEPGVFFSFMKPT